MNKKQLKLQQKLTPGNSINSVVFGVLRPSILADHRSQVVDGFLVVSWGRWFDKKQGEKTNKLLVTFFGCYNQRLFQHTPTPHPRQSPKPIVKEIPL